MVALLFANNAVTLVPGPFRAVSAAAARKAAERSPKYRDLVAAWGWSSPLWTEGVIAGELLGESPTGDMRQIARRIDQDGSLEILRGLMRPELFDSETRFLELVGSDLLKGGPDPAITVPIAAAIDNFASRHGLFVARSQPTSVVQKAESKLAAEAVSIAVPAILQASGEQFVIVRDLLERELGDVRLALDAARESPSAAMTDACRRELNRAARAYADAFDREHEEIVSPASDDDERVIVGTVVISLSWLPFDAVLRSSVEAAGVLVGRRAAAQPAAGKLPAKSWCEGSSTVPSLTIRIMGSTKSR